jgi:hypothetical protein
MHRRSAVAEAAVAADAVVVDGPRDINRRRLRAAAATGRLCRDHKPNQAAHERREQAARAAQVAPRALPLEIDPLRELTDRVQQVVQLLLITARPTINVPAHRVKRDRASQPIVLKSLLVDDHNRELAIGRARVEVRLRHNWMTS